MFICNCGHSVKTEKGFSNHIAKCEYVDLDINKVYNLGYLIDSFDKKLFHVHLGSIRKHSKETGLSQEEAKKELQKSNIYKYRKSLWDILMVWRDELLASEFRTYLKWLFKTYNEVTLLSLRNTLANPKIIYRFNLENTASMIGKRIDDSLVHIHQHGDFSNDFEFVDAIMSGSVSMYYVLFNDWLASKWFGRLDLDLQKELEEYVEIASKTVLERLKKEEFESLQELSNTDTPKIYEMDY